MFEKIRSMKDIAVASWTFIYLLGYVAWAFNAYINKIGLLPALDLQYFVSGVFPFIIIAASWKLLTFLTQWSDRTTNAKLDKLSLISAFTIAFILAIWFAVSHSIKAFHLPEEVKKYSSIVCVILIALTGLALLFFESAKKKEMSFSELVEKINREGLIEKIKSIFRFLFFEANRLYSRISFAFSFAIIVFITFIAYLNVYEKIPQELGGVKPRSATIWIDPQKVDTNILGPNVMHDKSIETQVLYKSEKVIIVKMNVRNVPSILELNENCIQMIKWK